MALQFDNVPSNFGRNCVASSVEINPQRRKKIQRCRSMLDHECQPSAKRLRTLKNGTSSSSSSSANRPMRKTVSFSEADNRRVVLVHSTPEEKQNAWYNPTEYKQIREDVQATALSVRLGISDIVIKPEDFCLRGLEANLSPDMAILRRLRRQLLVESILKEQQAQRIVGTVNHEVIRELSTILSTDSQIDAVQRGVSDSQV